MHDVDWWNNPVFHTGAKGVIVIITIQQIKAQTQMQLYIIFWAKKYRTVIIIIIWQKQ